MSFGAAHFSHMDQAAKRGFINRLDQRDVIGRQSLTEQGLGSRFSIGSSLLGLWGGTLFGRSSPMAVIDYLPCAEKIPNSVGLSLSGGGFRATLFHLGALRRLNEFGIVPKLTTVSSVSGGSILNGFLASRLAAPLANGIADFDGSVSKPVRQFCSLDIRRWLALEAVIPGTHNSSGLAKQYDQNLTSGKLLKDIPATPVHIFCSTDLAYGVNWMFKKQQCATIRQGFKTHRWTGSLARLWQLPHVSHLSSSLSISILIQRNSSGARLRPANNETSAFVRSHSVMAVYMTI